MTAIYKTLVDPLARKFNELTTNSLAYKPHVPAKAAKVDEEALKAKVFGTSYEPSIELWEQDQRDYVKPEHDPVPEGFPELAVTPSLWDGKVLINEPEKWLHTFTEAEIADLEAAHDHFLSLGLPYSGIQRSTFPITVSKPVFAKAVEEIHNGLGLRVLRGLPVKKWDRPKQIVIFAGIGAWIGDKRLKQQGVQNIVHLRDITRLAEDDRPAIVVKGQTSGNQVFHTDAGDVVGLLTLGVAETGGLSQLSSIAQTYNYFSQHRRDILRELASPDWITAQNLDGNQLIHYVNGRVIAQYARRPFFSFFDAERAEGVPELPAKKHVALDAVHFTAEKFSLDIDLQEGDLEFFNNLQVFHARTASEDSDENVRHLIRIWVRNEEYALEHGPKLDKLFNNLADGEPTTWPLEAWDKAENSDAYVVKKAVITSLG